MVMENIVTDIVDKATRSNIMSRIKANGTSIERKVGSALFACGFRYRKNDPKQPGKPDLYLPKYSAVVMVHGCFWHRHGCKRSYAVSGPSKERWEDKFRRNTERDKEVLQSLKAKGLRVAIIWECYVLRHSKEEIAKQIAPWILSDEPFLELPKIEPAEGSS